MRRGRITFATSRVIAVLGLGIAIAGCKDAASDPTPSATETGAGTEAVTSDGTATTGVPTTGSGNGETGRDTDGQGTGGPGLPPGEGCCDPHVGPGCNEPTVQECVCGQMPTCCGFDWERGCVDVAENACNATCQGSATTEAVGDTGDPSAGGSSSGASSAGETTGDPDPDPGTWVPGGTCCQPMQEGSTGCSEPAIEACVCALDDYCCETAWDFQCVQEAAGDCQAACGDCCDNHNYAGCSQPEVVTCVCAFDAYCCDEVWDNQCVQEAQDDCNLAC